MLVKHELLCTIKLVQGRIKEEINYEKEKASDASIRKVKIRRSATSPTILSAFVRDVLFCTYQIYLQVKIYYSFGNKY
jgi:hypothetical protein